MTNALFFSIMGLIGFAIGFYLFWNDFADYKSQKRKDAYLKSAIDKYMDMIPKIMGQIRKAADGPGETRLRDLSRDLAEELRQLLLSVTSIDPNFLKSVLSENQQKELHEDVINGREALKNYDYYVTMQEESND